jgi:tRNA A-37 threonylcarbamoyl transferase component Bud32
VHFAVIHPGIRLERLDPSEKHLAEQWGAALRIFDPVEAHALKDSPADSDGVWRTSMLGASVVIKCVSLRSARARVASALGLSRGFRQWRGARLLGAAQIPTARMLVHATEYARPFPREWLVMEHIEGATALAELGAGRCDATLCNALGAQVGEMTRDASIFNRDHKPSNLVVHRTPTGLVSIVLIDTVGVSRVRWSPNKAAARMLASLVIEPTGCGVALPDLYLDALTLGWSGGDPCRAAQMARAVHEIVISHGDPTPRINPLASQTGTRAG